MPTQKYATPTPVVEVTPLPARGPFEPAKLLPYLVQTGDTVTAIAAHFNTTVDQVLKANPSLPLTATLSSGQTIQVPAYYFALGGPTLKIIPDSEFVFGPATTDFDVAEYLESQPGYIRNLSAFVSDRQRSNAETILYLARQYSINPRLLLALLEWRSGALTKAEVPADVIANPLNLPDDGGLARFAAKSGFYLQLHWAAEQLSIGYYGWRNGTLTSISLSDTYLSRVDMYQNAGTVGVQYLLGQMLPHDEFDAAAGPEGFAATYYALWGNPFAHDDPPDVIPGNLTQPALTLPFVANQQWALTGGPHPGWGTNLPWS
ncbi:MAG: LysM peptidoglycan-binding domain-containing protein, partial [Anaerolineales bacterium]